MGSEVAIAVRAGPQEREQLCAAYERYLIDRDGTPGPDGETLSLREEQMRRLRSQRVRYTGPTDEALFIQRYYQPGDAPPELQLLLAFVKINAQEAFAVESIRRVKRNLTPVLSRMLVQENYHTQLLVSAADLFHVQVPGPLPPLVALRILITGVAYTPPSIMHPLSLAGEIMGVAMFLRLLRATRTTLREHPELRDAMEERVMQVCTDEIGHLSYNRLMVGPLGMTVARALLPLMAAGFRKTQPELDALSGGPITMRELAGLTFDDLPEAARRHAFIA
jgi:hypothetical protein